MFPCLSAGRDLSERAHERMSTRAHEPSPYLAMGNDPVNRIDPTGGKSQRTGSGANVTELEYTGRTKSVDPFDMVGPSGGLSAAYSNYDDFNADQEFISWAGSGEGDYRNMIETERIIKLREEISELIKGFEQQNFDKNKSPDNFVASNDIEQAMMLLSFASGEPTIDKGGFIDGYDAFINFMFNAAENIGVELMGYEILDPKTNELKYYILPWINNTQTESYSNVNGIPGYKKEDIIQQFHTHPKGVSMWASLKDVKYSNRWNIPVNAVSFKGTICRVFLPSELKVSNVEMSYGVIIYRKP